MKLSGQDLEEPAPPCRLTAVCDVRAIPTSISKKLAAEIRDETFPRSLCVIYHIQNGVNVVKPKLSIREGGLSKRGDLKEMDKDPQSQPAVAWCGIQTWGLRVQTHGLPLSLQAGPKHTNDSK